MKEAGGTVYAESEETAAIYGMPREALARAPEADVVPLDDVAGWLRALVVDA